MSPHEIRLAIAKNLRVALHRGRFIFFSLGDPYYAKRLFSTAHTYVYLSIFLAFALSYSNAHIGLTFFILILITLSSICYVHYLLERVASLKTILSVEQTKSMLKDGVIRETLFHKKELQYRIDKLTNPNHDSNLVLPAAHVKVSRPKSIPNGHTVSPYLKKPLKKRIPD